MGWYEAIKDGIATTQKADNIPLAQNLMDAQKQIFDLIDENQKLKEQIKELQETADISKKIERHEDAYITLADDPDKRIYCSCCWDTKKILVQGQKPGVGTYCCPACGTNAYYDKEAYDKHQKEIANNIGARKYQKISF